jgi:hypothetical protein
VDYTNGKQWIAQISDFIEQVSETMLAFSVPCIPWVLLGCSTQSRVGGNLLQCFMLARRSGVPGKDSTLCEEANYGRCSMHLHESLDLCVIEIKQPIIVGQGKGRLLKALSSGPSMFFFTSHKPLWHLSLF